MTVPPGDRFYTADVFTTQAFGGNPLAVFPQAAAISSDRMQAIARELNLSETVFVLPPATATGTRRLRIFTPGSEIPFAGHPTVGTAFVLAAIGELPLTGETTAIVFEEGVGPVPVTIRSQAGQPVFSELEAAQRPVIQPIARSLAELGAIVGLEAADLAVPGWQPATASCGLPFSVIPVRDSAALAAARLDLGRWEQTLARSEAPQVYLVTGLGSDRLTVRMFAPALGIAEDPATGAAAAALGGYLVAGRSLPDGEHQWAINQGAAIQRPSELTVRVTLIDGQIDRVRVGGRSVLMSEGVIYS
jgi:trans-2,3-dihydro-3-hydroxyanthranilate isomerase